MAKHDNKATTIARTKNPEEKVAQTTKSRGNSQETNKRMFKTIRKIMEKMKKWQVRNRLKTRVPSLQRKPDKMTIMTLNPPEVTSLANLASQESLPNPLKRSVPRASPRSQKTSTPSLNQTSRKRAGSPRPTSKTSSTISSWKSSSSKK